MLRGLVGMWRLSRGLGICKRPKDTDDREAFWLLRSHDEWPCCGTTY